MADSGALIGLSRSDLEQSLETLEMMAGEIGASVIVVKEIEVPPAMVAFADKVSAYIDPETGKWTEKMSNKRFRHGCRGDAAFAGIEAETDTTDTDDDPSTLATPNFPPALPDGAAVVPYSHRLTSAHPTRPSSQSSPYIAPLDDDLALFSMEPEPEFAEETDDDTKADDALEPSFPEDGDVPDISLDIEISSVFKPRPFRKRGDQPGASVFGGKQGRRAMKPVKEKKPWTAQSSSVPNVTGPGGATSPNKQEDKALLRRLARDKRREERRKALLAHAVPDTVAEGVTVAEVAVAVPTKNVAVDVVKLQPDVADLAADLQTLHIAVAPATVVVDEASTPSPNTEGSTSTEPRLIVEALVVRKLSIEEGFLDFAGFSLT